MNKQLLKDSLGWGLALWFTGYVLGIILFLLLPARLICWAIMPIGVIITFWRVSEKYITTLPIIKCELKIE